MKWNNKFNYPKSSRSNEDGFRKYLFGDKKLPSVTSILSATKSEEDKASLENWKERVGHKEANRIKNEASSRGTSMHFYIEDFFIQKILFFELYVVPGSFLGSRVTRVGVREQTHGGPREQDFLYKKSFI